jgi:hypothetical protein
MEQSRHKLVSRHYHGKFVVQNLTIELKILAQIMNNFSNLEQKKI